MYHNTISNLAITGEVADQIFTGVKGNTFNGDVSMLGMARMLLHPRGINATVSFYSFDERSSVEGCISSLANDTLAVISAATHEAAEGFAVPDGFKYLQVPSQFYTKMNKYGSSERSVSFHTDPIRHITVCVVERLRTQLFHILAGGFSVFMPWVFTDKESELYQPLTAKEKEICRGFANPNGDQRDFVRAANEFAEQFDFQTVAKQLYLKGFEDSAIGVRIDGLRNRVDEFTRRVRDAEDLLRERYGELEAVRLELFGLENAPSKGTSELMEYFLQNKKLFITECTGTTQSKRITFVVSGYMDDFDAEVYEDIRANQGSYLYRSYNPSGTKLSQEDYLLLMDALFKYESVRLKMCSAWRLTTSSYEMMSGFNYPSQFDDVFRNSHIDAYGCRGSFSTHLNSAIGRYDYVALLDLISLENGNINLTDSAVIPGSFIPELLRAKGKIIELPDGRSVTTVEAVQWLRENA